MGLATASSLRRWRSLAERFVMPSTSAPRTSHSEICLARNLLSPSSPVTKLSSSSKVMDRSWRFSITLTSCAFGR